MVKPPDFQGQKGFLDTPKVQLEKISTKFC